MRSLLSYFVAGLLLLLLAPAVLSALGWVKG
ncbi:hypothetical protein JOD78_003847 [Herbaspirillum sp. 1130]|nr:hypothetical protein [Herbaspirillum sp. 1130]